MGGTQYHWYSPLSTERFQDWGFAALPSACLLSFTMWEHPSSFQLSQSLVEKHTAPFSTGKRFRIQGCYVYQIERALTPGWPHTDTGIQNTIKSTNANTIKSTNTNTCSKYKLRNIKIQIQV